VLAFCVVVFGAYVRLTAAGLGCPDWPGCYGHVTPTGAAAANAGISADPGEVGKAWREMIHRYAASTLGLIILVMAGLAVKWRRQKGLPVKLPLVLLALVIFQGVLGMLTVTWLLKPLVVTAHLVFGLTTLSLLWWLWMSLRRVSTDPWSGSEAAAGGGSAAAMLRPAAPAVRTAALVGAVALGFQIVLGGWTSTNYAAVACPDFPTCQASWWPEAEFGEAFDPWHGLGINYEGGVLTAPRARRDPLHAPARRDGRDARAALRRVHGAARARRRPQPRRGDRRARRARAAARDRHRLMVVKGFPLTFGTAHNAGAALLLLATLALNRALRRA
jgi:heme a synthase